MLVFSHIKYYHIQSNCNTSQFKFFFSFLYIIFVVVVVDAQDLNVEKGDTFHAAEEAQLDPGSKMVTDDISVDHEEGLPQTQEVQIVLEEEHSKPHVTVEDYRGHFNNNQDDQPSFGGLEELPVAPQDTPESPVDVGLGLEVEHSHSGWSTAVYAFH